MSITVNHVIVLEIFPNIFKRLTVSLVPLKFLLWQQHQFCLFQLVSSLSLLCRQMCTFCCHSGRRSILLPKGSDLRIQKYIYQKIQKSLLTIDFSMLRTSPRQQCIFIMEHMKYFTFLNTCCIKTQLLSHSDIKSFSCTGLYAQFFNKALRVFAEAS